jgi:hypothetical protein
LAINNPIIFTPTMNKFIVLIALFAMFALTFSAEECPTSLFNKCSDDIKKGNPEPIKPSLNAKKQLKRRVLTRSQTLNAHNSSLALGRIAGLAFAKSPRKST